MSKLIYVDTNVFLDYLQQRSSKYLDYQGFAVNLFNRTLSCEFTLLVSDITLFEIKKVISLPESFLKDILHKVKFVNTVSKHKQKSKEISIHFPDNLHCAIALIEGCHLIVSNDKEMQCLSLDIPIISSQDL
jgi:predicted nucleic acid-binding protein